MEESRRYEAPVLIDVAEIAGPWCVCLTGGGGVKPEDGPDVGSGLSI